MGILPPCENCKSEMSTLLTLSPSLRLIHGSQGVDVQGVDVDVPYYSVQSGR